MLILVSTSCAYLLSSCPAFVPRTNSTHSGSPSFHLFLSFVVLVCPWLYTLYRIEAEPVDNTAYYVEPSV